MKYLAIVLFLFCIGIKQANAQEENYHEPGGNSNWYVELGGNALLYSINYEKHLKRSNDYRYTLTGRVGASFNPLDYRFLNKVDLIPNSFIFPFSSTVFMGGGKEKIEAGAGFTLLTKNFSDKEILVTFTAGFRVIEMNKVCFRVAYTPFIREGEFVSWFGVSLGRKF